LRRWVVLFLMLILMIPASVGLAETKSESVNIETPLFMEPVSGQDTSGVGISTPANPLGQQATAKSIAKYTTEELFQQVSVFQPRELILNFRDGVTKEQKLTFFKSNQLTERSMIADANVSLVEVSHQTQDLKAFALSLAKSELIQFVEPNTVVKQSFIPSDKSFKKQWYLNQISAPKAWDTTRGSSSITVAVIDGGVQKDHPDLAGKIVKPYNAVTGGTIYKTDNHGTHVAGIIAASMNGKGIAGVAPNVKIMPINAFTSYGAAAYDVVHAIYYAVHNGANVINLSLGGYNYSYSMDEAIRYAFTKGTVIIAAAGNSDTYYNTYPAAYDGAFGVSATNSNDKITQFSNYGNYIDFAAPGEDIYSTVAGSGYDYMDGTSMASPVVAGVAALILSKNPLLSPNEVKAILASSAIDLGNGGWDYFYGYGRVNAYRALQATPLPMSGITASSKSFTMKGTNRHVFSFRAQGGTNVSVYIKNQGGTIVKRLVNQLWSGGTVTTLWDGKMDNGNYAKDGNYKIIATVASGRGSFTKSFDFKVLDKVAPSIKLTNPTQYFSPINSDKVIIPFELNKKAKVTAIVYDNTGNKERTILDGKNLNPGKQSISWLGNNAAGTKVKDGSYQIVMTYIADNKMAGAKRTGIILVDSVKPTTTITLSDSAFNRDGVNPFKGQVQLTEKVTVNAYIVDQYGAKVKTIAYDEAYQSGTVNFIWDGTNDYDQPIPEGQYRYVIELTDLAGNKGTITSSLFNLQDQSLPVITSEDYVDVVAGNAVAIPYSVNKDGFVTIGIYKNNQLVQELMRDEAITSGNHSFVWSGNGFADGNYQFRITFRDQYDQKVEFTGDIQLTSTDIKIDYPDVVQLLKTGNTRAEVYFELSNAATVTVDIYDVYGYRQRTILKDQYLQKGIRKFEWNGRNESGAYTSGNEFSYIIRAKNQFGKVTTVEGLISDRAYPSWLITHSITFNKDSEGKVASANLNINIEKEVKLHFAVYTSLTSVTPVGREIYSLSKGMNLLTYSKPTTDPLYYFLLYEDRLGNLYGYVTDES
jgi:subtilisin family serine protease/flagellar hook assembly protein FlgD